MAQLAITQMQLFIPGPLVVTVTPTAVLTPDGERVVFAAAVEGTAPPGDSPFAALGNLAEAIIAALPLIQEPVIGPKPPEPMGFDKFHADMMNDSKYAAAYHEARARRQQFCPVHPNGCGPTHCSGDLYAGFMPGMSIPHECGPATCGKSGILCHHGSTTMAQLAICCGRRV